MSQSQTTPTSPSSHSLSTVKTRILIISDTHATPLPPSSTTPLPSTSTSSNNNNVPFRSPLPKADVLLHCGDLTLIGKLSEYEKALDMLESIDAPLKLVIAGNHDISLDKEFFKRRGAYMQSLKEPDENIPQKAREMWKGERAKRAGVTYLEEGTYSFILGNGAQLRVYASPYTPEFCDFAFPIYPNEDRFNPPRTPTSPPSSPSSPSLPSPSFSKRKPNAELTASNPIPDFPAIDIIMTHGPPYSILDTTTNGLKVGCPHLLRAAHRARPKVHCFGHIHEGWGAERVVWRDGSDSDEGGVEGGKYVVSRERVDVDEEKMVEERAAVVDVTKDAGRALKVGRETLMVNASIMDVRYRARQGPWVVDLDLEKAE